MRCEGRRSLRIAAGALRESRQVRALRAWAAQRAARRAAAAQLSLAGTRLERALRLMRLAQHLRWWAREMELERRVELRRSSMAQLVLADSKLYRRRLAGGWRCWSAMHARVIAAHRRRCSEHRLRVAHRRRKLAAGFGAWARSPRMHEFRRWKHQEAVLHKMTAILAASPVAEGPKSALASVLESHRASLDVMRALEL